MVKIESLVQTKVIRTTLKYDRKRMNKKDENHYSFTLQGNYVVTQGCAVSRRGNKWYYLQVFQLCIERVSSYADI